MPSKHIPYFRFYPADFMGGVRGLSAQEVGVYTMLLCRMYEENGPIEYHVLRLATYCGMREKTFQAVAEKLIALGKIDLEAGMIFNDRAAREISNRSNDLENAITAGKASAEKRQRKQGRKSTPVQRPFNHTDTDTDTDTSIKEEPKGSSKKTRRKPEVDLPEGWVPSERNVMDAEGIGLTAKEIENEAAQFCDYHNSKQSRYRDWDAAWRTWCRNAAKRRTSRGMAFGTQPGRGQHGGSIAAIVARRQFEG
jgi:uncharacterized protein YdaU (DUF1376 family)